MVVIMCRRLGSLLLAIFLTVFLVNTGFTSPQKLTVELLDLQKRTPEITFIPILVSLTKTQEEFMPQSKVSKRQDEFLGLLLKSKVPVKVLHRFKFAPVIYLEVSAGQLLKVADISIVQSIDINRENVISLESSIPFIGANHIHPSADGTGRAVAIVDTPVNPSHSEFGNCADLASDQCRVKAIVNFTDNQIADVSPVHGSNVAGITLGMAPSTDIYSLN